MRRASILAIVLALTGAGTLPGHTFDISRLLANAPQGEGFKLIHVAQLEALMAQRPRRVMVFDANPPDVRASEGVVPGARMLPSADAYDVAAELPEAKNTPLVFYCHDSH